ncbi:uncharacterized protein [Drosophila takahashii]|uniref:uncharacterized protein isoform X1 n=1 Tax=Drosophila takahashii TaxID=29030 RepID=UPI00389904D4
MFQTSLAIIFCICCSIGILRLNATPIPSAALSQGTTSIEVDSMEPMEAQETSRNPLATPTRESQEWKQVTSLYEVLAPTPNRDRSRVKRFLGGLAPGLRLFPVNDGYGNPAKRRSRTKNPRRLKDKTTKKSTQMAKFRAEGEDDEAGEAGDARQAEATTGAFVRPTELTISIRKTDKFGQWVYNPWGATFGKVWQDTRFHVNHQSRMPRLHIDSDPGMDYYPDDEGISTVCLGRSTVYNVPRIMKYLTGKRYRSPHVKRAIWMGYRRNIFKLGRSEECRTMNLTEWLPFQECNLRRHQRMEYVLYKYPKHQL